MIQFFLNNNMNNIVLDHVISDMSVNFLDLTITTLDTRISTKVYLKPTDRNSYLSIRSGHHPAWIRNIPKGQMLRVRRNCTELEDCFEQAETLKEKFIQKGYNQVVLDNNIIEIADTKRTMSKEQGG